jgi:Protein of unknown function (DUF2934)
MPRATALRTTKRASSTNGESAGATVTVISAPNTLENEIRLRAYLLYENEGRQDGHDDEYWLRAESEILEQYGLRSRG